VAPEERPVKGRMDRANGRRATESETGAVRGRGSEQTQKWKWGEAGKDGIKTIASDLSNRTALNE